MYLRIKMKGFGWGKTTTSRSRGILTREEIVWLSVDYLYRPRHMGNVPIKDLCRVLDALPQLLTLYPDTLGMRVQMAAASLYYTMHGEFLIQNKPGSSAGANGLRRYWAASRDFKGRAITDAGLTKQPFNIISQLHGFLNECHEIGL
jgi:hypothetical protein